MIWLIIRSTRDHFFKNFFSKLDFLGTVSVTIIANSEKMKMKISHLSITFTFPLPSPFSPYKCFKKLPPPPSSPPSYSIFWNFHLPSSDLEGIENYVYSSKNLIFDFFCVFLLEHFDVFECCYCCRPCLIWLFAKIFKTSIFITK